MARIHWVAIEDWNALPAGELTSLLKDARELTYKKLPQRTKDVLALPPKQLSKLVAERRKLLASKAAEEKAGKQKAAVKSAVRAGTGAAKRRSK